MAQLLSCQSISKTFGSRTLFEGISLTISEGDRIGLIGPNGAGKSTLLEILAGELPVDEGIIAPRKLLRLGYVPQEDSFDAEKSVERDHGCDGQVTGHLTEAERAGRTSAALGRAGFTDSTVPAGTLSGGWRKRLAIARELLKDPELLLLDEPTNHLDLEGILWLEKLLKAGPFASLVVSHDRYFLENTATSMMEINRALSGRPVPCGRELQHVSRKAGAVSARAGEVPGIAREQSSPRDRMAAARGQGADLEIEGADRRGAGADGRVERRVGAHREPQHADRFHGHGPAHQAPDRSGAHRQSHRRAAAVSRSFAGAVAGCAAGIVGPERQRQDHAAAHTGGRDRAGFREREARRRRARPVFRSGARAARSCRFRCERPWLRKATR